MNHITSTFNIVSFAMAFGALAEISRLKGRKGVIPFAEAALQAVISLVIIAFLQWISS